MLFEQALYPNLFRFDFVGASLLAAFLTRPGRNNPGCADVAAGCGTTIPPSAIQDLRLTANPLRKNAQGIAAAGQPSR
jgi:hypothetical protein